MGKKKVDDVLAVHTVRHTAMSRNAVTEVLDVEGTFQSRSEEPSEWRDKRGEARHEEQMNLVRRIGNGSNRVSELQRI